jgi:hypothetical protein
MCCCTLGPECRRAHNQTYCTLTRAHRLFLNWCTQAASGDMRRGGMLPASRGATRVRKDLHPALNFSGLFAWALKSLENNLHHLSQTRSMLQPGQSPHHAASFSSNSRRNLPRASHACQWCRAKKAKCNQQQPCSNCVKHSIDCEYGIRRRAGRKKSNYIQERAYIDTSERESAFPSPASTLMGHNRQSEGKLPRQPQEMAPPSTHKLLNFLLFA